MTLRTRTNIPGRRCSCHRRILVLVACLFAICCSYGAGQAAGQQITPSFQVAPAGGDPLSAYARQQSWFSRDKFYHFGISAAGAGGFYWAGRRLGLNRGWAALGSVTLMGGIGVLREIGNRDRTNLLTQDHVSRKDLVWDASGIIVGITVTGFLMRPHER
ncbi:MAG: hypothetical protein M3P24_12015 [Gemmatimonadota bacterium]|nr:hypothetical protein [Gemmatimonadota bacterium]